MTEVDLANRALGAIGARTTITSLVENSPEAIACAREFAPARDELLRKAHWDFARKAINGTVLKSAPGTPGNTDPATAIWVPATQPPLPWLFEYQYPSDCMQVRRIVPQLTSMMGLSTPIFTNGRYAYPVNPNTVFVIPFVKAYDTSLAQTVILTNQYQAIIEYTFKQTAVAFWDSMFTEAFVILLATKIVFELTGKVSITRDAMERYMFLVEQAQAADANEGLTIWNTESEFIAARTYGDGELY